jgi:hypothetical protein
MTEKKSCVDDQKLRDWTKWFVAIYSVLWEKYNFFTTWFSFSVNKKQKNYKVKLSTNLILKKNKIILEGKKPMKKKRCSNWQCFVRKTITLFPIK